MSQAYLLQCDCGQALRVESRQAGERLGCSCGKSIQVPALRELRRLPRAQSTAQLQRDQSSWSKGRGLTFVAGVVMTTVAAAALVYLLGQRLRGAAATSTLDRFLAAEDLSDLSAAELMEAWEAYRDFGPQWGHSPQYLEARRQATEVNTLIWVAVLAIMLGLALIVSSLYLSRDGAG